MLTESPALHICTQLRPGSRFYESTSVSNNIMVRNVTERPAQYETSTSTPAALTHTPPLHRTVCAKTAEPPVAVARSVEGR